MLNVTLVFHSVCASHIIFGFCRIIGFWDHWPSLEQWFTEPENILIKMNAEVDEQSLCQKVKEMFMAEIMKKENKGNYSSL